MITASYVFSKHTDGSSEDKDRNKSSDVVLLIRVCVRHSVARLCCTQDGCLLIYVQPQASGDVCRHQSLSAVNVCSH